MVLPFPSSLFSLLWVTLWQSWWAENCNGIQCWAVNRFLWTFPNCLLSEGNVFLAFSRVFCLFIDVAVYVRQVKFHFKVGLRCVRVIPQQAKSDTGEVAFPFVAEHASSSPIILDLRPGRIHPSGQAVTWICLLFALRDSLATDQSWGGSVSDLETKCLKFDMRRVSLMLFKCILNRYPCRVCRCGKCTPSQRQTLIGEENVLVSCRQYCTLIHKLSLWI